MKALEINCKTGESQERDLTQEEIDLINKPTEELPQQLTEVEVLKLKVQSLEQINAEISTNQQLLIELLIDMEVI